MKKTNIVIIGAGFGGLYTYKFLTKFLKNKNTKISVFDENNYFLFTPMLHEVATGGLDPVLIVESITNIVSTNFICKEVQSVDFDKNLIKAQDLTFNYDILVLSTGSKTNYFGNNKIRDFTTGLKSISDARMYIRTGSAPLTN